MKKENITFLAERLTYLKTHFQTILKENEILRANRNLKEYKGIEVENLVLKEQIKIMERENFHELNEGSYEESME